MSAAASRAKGALFVATILTGSFLLFLVQPMVARMALPRLGGAPAVWNSAMLIYQALLLGGYAYAHWLGRLKPRTGAGVHLAVLAIAALWLPIGLWNTDLPPDAEPAIWVPWLLGASIGPLFFAVSAQAPLMQRWFSRVAPGREPYALYAASNVGSFGGLIAYPLVLEPLATLHVQSWLWTAGYALLALLVLACAALLPRSGEAAIDHVESPAPGARRVALWIILAFVPSGLMLATSTFLTTDIVAVPLLWVLPLGLYLLSFTIAFATRRFAADIITRFAPLTVLMFGGVMIGGGQEMPYLNAALALILLFMASVALHARMYALRPAADRLTGFYLAMSVGGALGGVFAGLLAPVIFDWTYEYPLLILAAGALVPQMFLLPFFRRLWGASRRSLWSRSAVVGLATAAVAVFCLVNPGQMLGEKNENIGFLVIAGIGIFTVGARPAFMAALASALVLFGGYRAIATSLEGDARSRSYFGVYTVREYPDRRTLAHGTTLHGVQLKGARATTPTSYYVRDSGVGQAMRAAPGLYGPGVRIGLVGLGTGTLACYARPGQRWTIFEIDPAIVRLARDTGKFTFLRRCLPNPNIVIGDARTRLSAQPQHSLDLLALDAFSSDAVPMHLMTAEAFDTYGRVLERDGLLLVHISNRFLDLEPVVAAAADKGGWHATKLSYNPPLADILKTEAAGSEWIALSREPATIMNLIVAGGGWEPLVGRKNFRPWTDDYATILPLMRETPW